MTMTIDETLAPQTAVATGSRPFPLIRHSLTLAKRSVVKIRRTPEQLLDVTLQPMIFVLLFVYIFGGAIAGNTHDYLEYVLPAIMVQTLAFSSVAIGVNLNTDISKGVFDRFRSLPIPRPAPLVGAVLGDIVRYCVSVIVLMAFGYLLGFRIQTNVFSATLACLIVIGFSLCLSWISVFVGMVLRSPGAVQGVGFLLIFPLTFGSNLFVPTDTLPSWLQTWVHINPVTYLVDTTRALMLGGEVLSPLLKTIASALVILVIFAPLAVRAYRRKA